MLKHAHMIDLRCGVVPALPIVPIADKISQGLEAGRLFYLPLFDRFEICQASQSKLPLNTICPATSPGPGNEISFSLPVINLNSLYCPQLLNKASMTFVNDHLGNMMLPEGTMLSKKNDIIDKILMKM